ncbi:hypothetical protein Tco_0635494 [Tanacetum coccineum]
MIHGKSSGMDTFMMGIDTLENDFASVEKRTLAKCKRYDDSISSLKERERDTTWSTTLRFTLVTLGFEHIQDAIASSLKLNTKFLNTLPDEWCKFVY